MSFEINGKIYETDENGYLKNPAQWNREIAKYLAKLLGID
jgi:sulfur relay (sulfurtransferase) DsrC/TusE family protein